MTINRTGWIWLVIAIPVFAFAQNSIPPRPTGFVNDYANVFAPENTARLEQLCRIIQFQLDSIEFAVVTVPSLEDNAIEEVAVRWFEAWKIGKKGKDNGLLLMIAPKERKVKLEVGYGLEPILNDALAGEMLDRGFVNTFRMTQNYGDAAFNTVSLIALRIAKIEGKKLDGVQLQPVKQTQRRQSFPYLWVIFIIFFIVMRSRSRYWWLPGIFGGFGGFGGGGGGFGGFGGGGFGGFGGGGSGGGGASRSF